MALWLACDCGKTTGKYLVQARAKLSEVPSGICNEGAERISLASNFIKSLPQVSLCHNLITMLLNDNLVNMISRGFFESMRGLRVLDLSGNEGITKLPVEISLLVSIQYLNLAGTGITELPEELGGLIRLKYLDLTYTINLRKFPVRTLSSIESLRVLKMFGCHSSIFNYICDNESVEKVAALLVIYSMLKHTELLSLTIRKIPSPEEVIHYLELIRLIRGLCIYRLGLSHLEFTPKLLELTINASTERLEMTDCGHNTPLFDMQMLRKFGVDWNLRSVFIVRCSRMQNLTWLSFAKMLKFLLVADCKDIQVILTDENYVLDHPFDSLEEMYLIELPELLSVTSANIKLRSLRCIGVEGCPKLTNVSVDSDNAVTIQGSEDWWNGLPEKPAAFACITDPKEIDKKRNESSASVSASTSTPTSYPDAYLPYFMSYD